MIDQTTIGTVSSETSQPSCCRSEVEAVVTSVPSELKIIFRKERTIMTNGNHVESPATKQQDNKSLKSLRNDETIHETAVANSVIKNGTVDGEFERNHDHEKLVKSLVDELSLSIHHQNGDCVDSRQSRGVTYTNGSNNVEMVEHANTFYLSNGHQYKNNLNGCSSESISNGSNLFNDSELMKEETSAITRPIMETSSSELVSISIENKSVNGEMKDQMKAPLDNLNGSEGPSSDCKPISIANAAIAEVPIGDTMFPLLTGEKIVWTGQTSNGIIIVTSYRIFIRCEEYDELSTSIPLGSIDSVEQRDPCSLCINTKLVYTVVCSFHSGDQCSIWFKQLTDAVSSTKSKPFAFAFHSTMKENQEGDDSKILSTTNHVIDSFALFESELARLNFIGCGSWRVTDINKEFKFCPSYPRFLVVPSSVTDEELDKVALFRFSRRIPTAVWRSPKNGMVIARSSQPVVGWFGWRSDYDECLLNAYLTSCLGSEQDTKKLLVVDARSYPAAVANRAKGGGVECAEYYPCSEVQFMGLANIHAVRKSFHALRCLTDVTPDNQNWATILDNSKWLQHISSLIRSSLIIVKAISEECRPVLVHCSDGWDRTPQIVSLAQLMLDPYYRTIDGFQALVNREWVEFGHKFADRCGLLPVVDDPNERSPIFLQWLDCVHQILRQYPHHFEFNVRYLVKIAHHINSCLFGTFMCNTMSDRFNEEINCRTYSVWTFLDISRNQFVNPYYRDQDDVLKPTHNLESLTYWHETYGSSRLMIQLKKVTSVNTTKVECDSTEKEEQREQSPITTSPRQLIETSQQKRDSMSENTGEQVESEKKRENGSVNGNEKRLDHYDASEHCAYM
ncbi:Myotubularin-related protein 3 [Halotydeus destructor]|nr:Myotubularin-related protein 3 [Halotydeus destructor]